MSVAAAPNLTSSELIRFRIAAARRILSRAGCDTWIGGHVSIRAVDEPDAFWVTSKNFADQTLPDSIWKLSFEEAPRVTGKGRVSNALGFHSAIYKARPDVNSIVHTHSEYASLFAAHNEPLGMYTIEAAPFQGPISRFEWVTKNDDAGLGAALGPTGKVVLMPNHGVVVVADCVQTATTLAIMFENAARMHFKGRLHGVSQLEASAAAAVSPAKRTEQTAEIWRSCIDRLWKTDYDLLSSVDPKLVEEA